jgi:hypothetical protein
MDLILEGFAIFIWLAVLFLKVVNRKPMAKFHLCSGQKKAIPLQAGWLF